MRPATGLGVFRFSSAGALLVAPGEEEVQTIPLTWVSNGDANGLIYYLGSNGGGGAFSAPSSVVTTVYYSNTGASFTTTVLQDRTFGTNIDTPPTGSSSRVTMDTGRSIRPNRYALQHAGTDSRWALRNWQLLGSTDGSSWDVLKTHINDSTLLGAAAYGSWSLFTNSFYRYFRIQITGLNSTSNYEIYISEMEFYGDLVVE